MTFAFQDTDKILETSKGILVYWTQLPQAHKVSANFLNFKFKH